MEILEPISYSDIFRDNKSDLKIIFYENSKNKITKVSFDKPDSISIIIGPEGGFSNKEVGLARDNDFIDVSLGNTVLKSTTALILGVGLVKMIVNDFVNYRTS